MTELTTEDLKLVRDIISMDLSLQKSQIWIEKKEAIRKEFPEIIDMLSREEFFRKKAEAHKSEALFWLDDIIVKRANND